MTAALLCAEGVRIAVDGATAIAALDLVTHGGRLVLVGDHAPLMRVLMGAAELPEALAPAPHAEIVEGRLTLLASDVARGEHFQRAGMAPLDPPMPGSWRVDQYLHWSGRLWGLSRRAAQQAAAACLHRLQLQALRRRQLRSLQRVERRAVVVAQALVCEPEVLVCEGPLSELGPAEAALLMPLLDRACAGRAAVVSVDQISSPGAEAELARRATDLCLLRDGELAAHGPPNAIWSEGTVAEISVTRCSAELREGLIHRGATVQGGPTHFAVTLPAGMTLTDLLGLAARLGTPVVRCTPLVG